MLAVVLAVVRVVECNRLMEDSLGLEAGWGLDTEVADAIVDLFPSKVIVPGILAVEGKGVAGSLIDHSLAAGDVGSLVASGSFGAAANLEAVVLAEADSLAVVDSRSEADSCFAADRSLAEVDSLAGYILEILGSESDLLEQPGRDIPEEVHIA